MNSDYKLAHAQILEKQRYQQIQSIKSSADMCDLSPIPSVGLYDFKKQIDYSSREQPMCLCMWIYSLLVDYRNMD